MPTVLVLGPYRFVFFSNDGAEPRHVHVIRDAAMAKWWLDPPSVAKNRGFTDREMNRIEKLVVEHRTTLIEAWDEFFGD